MEEELANQLLTVARVFGEAKGLKDSTVGRFCAQDGSFFTRIRDGRTFTVKKFDEVLLWFSANWPEGAEWPDGVARPDCPSPIASQSVSPTEGGDLESGERGRVPPFAPGAAGTQKGEAA
jgi:hypothetical protein